MAVILNNLPAGVAGDLTRENVAIVEYGALDGDVAYGSPVVFDTTKNAFRAVAGGDTKFYGVLTRIAPATPDAKDASVMVRGYIKVKVNGSPKRGDTVYVQTTAEDSKKVGDFVAAESTGKTAAFAGATFAVNGTDNNGITVIRVL